MGELSDIDQQFEDVVLEAQKHANDKFRRRKHLSQLARLIGKYGLPKPTRPNKYSDAQYREYLAEAHQRLWIFIGRNLDNYHPDYPTRTGDQTTVRKWLGVKLNFLFLDVIQDSNRQSKIRDRLDQNEGEEFVIVKDFCEETALRQLLQEDPEKVFQATHIKSRPNLTFQLIALRRLDGYQWSEIECEFQCKIATLSVFYQRNIKHFQPLFVKYLGDR